MKKIFSFLLGITMLVGLGAFRTVQAATAIEYGLIATSIGVAGPIQILDQFTIGEQREQAAVAIPVFQNLRNTGPGTAQLLDVDGNVVDEVRFGKNQTLDINATLILNSAGTAYDEVVTATINPGGRVVLQYTNLNVLPAGQR